MTIFIPFYDAFMDDSVYESWINLIATYLPNKNSSILDIACGTANLSISLSQMGYSIQGVDISEDMLAQAYANQVEKNTYFPLYQMDIRKLDGLNQSNLVMSSLDSMCYLENIDDVESTIESAYAHIVDKGYFIFDVHSLYKFNELFPGFQYHNYLGDDAFLWTTYQGTQENSVLHELTAFIYDDSINAYKRYNQDIYEYGYETKTYLNILSKVGFSKVEIFGDNGMEQATEQSERLFFVCQK